MDRNRYILICALWYKPVLLIKCLLDFPFSHLDSILDCSFSIILCSIPEQNKWSKSLITSCVANLEPCRCQTNLLIGKLGLFVEWSETPGSRCNFVAFGQWKLLNTTTAITKSDDICELYGLVVFSPPLLYCGLLIKRFLYQLCIQKAQA